MNRSVKKWVWSVLVIAGGAILGFSLGRDAIGPDKAPSSKRPSQARPAYQLDPPNDPGKSPSTPERRGASALEDLLFGIPNERVVQFKDDDAYRRFLAGLDGSGLRLLGTMDRFRAARVGFDDLSDLEDLLGEDDDMEGNFLVAIPQLPEVGAQPGAVPFGGNTLEWLGITGDNSGWGEGVKIAVLDTGVIPHVAFPNGVREIDLLTQGDPIAYHGHGTAVASQIAGQHGVTRGVAPSAELLSIRIADNEGLSSSFLLAEGILRAVDEGSDIINISMGSYGDSALVRNAVQYASDNGVLIVAASGNEGLDRPAYPAALEGVVAVGAVDAQGQVLDFSNGGEALDLTAPGYNVNAAWLENEFISFSGTSASTPIAVGAIAAATSEFGPIPIDNATLLVLENLNAAGAPGDDQRYGEGILDVPPES